MVVFTKTYVQCDLCEQQRELQGPADGWFRIDAVISKLGGGDHPGDKLTIRASDVCGTCLGAIQEGEFSTLFFAEHDPDRMPSR
jgi:hypothetical protein